MNIYVDEPTVKWLADHAGPPGGEVEVWFRLELARAMQEAALRNGT